MKLSVILPVFNEEANVRATLKEVDKVLKNMNMKHEIIAVDDGSTDGTWQELKIAASEIKGLQLLRCHKNNGKGQALKLGFEASSGELAVFFDAGLEIHPRHLVDFLELMEKSDIDVVIGSKRHPKSKVRCSTRRLFLSALHNTAVKLFLGLPVKDTQVGVKLFKHEALEKVMPRLLVRGYAFDVELLANINRKGYEIVEAPIELDLKPESEKIKFRDILKIALDILAISFRMRVLRSYDRKAS